VSNKLKLDRRDFLKGAVGALGAATPAAHLPTLVFEPEAGPQSSVNNEIAATKSE
jgi:hypothetical protein